MSLNILLLSDQIAVSSWRSWRHGGFFFISTFKPYPETVENLANNKLS